MRRATIAAAWIFGATVPLLGAVVFLFGCCALPFHAYIHKAMPLCHVAIGVISEHADHHDGAQQPMPARAKQEPVKRVPTDLPGTSHVSRATTSVRLATADAKAYRSFITLGAARSDQDIGLHLLDVTLLI